MAVCSCHQLPPPSPSQSFDLTGRPFKNIAWSLSQGSDATLAAALAATSALANISDRLVFNLPLATAAKVAVGTYGITVTVTNVFGVSNSNVQTVSGAGGWAGRLAEHVLASSVHSLEGGLSPREARHRCLLGFRA